MPGCPYFIANTFAHLLGGLLITEISSENPLIANMGTKPMTQLAFFMILLINIYALMGTEPGPMKYLLYGSLGVAVGQTMSGLAARLKQRGALSEVLTTTGLIFFTMATIGIVDNQNMLSWSTYLFAVLIVLLLAMLYNVFMTKTDKERNDWRVWLARGTVALFAIYIVFDVEVLKANAATCRGDPDYVGESVSLYLDLVNLVSGVSNAGD
jgi:FtsH-binding integral membrane protein